MSKKIVLRVSDDFYEELERRAKEEGYALVTDYVLEVLSRELERSPFNPRALEARLERLERGELPAKMQEAIWKLIEEALENKLSAVAVEGLSLDEKQLLNKLVDEAVKKIERKVVDMINPWSQKVDSLSRQLGELLERLEELEGKQSAQQQEHEEARREPLVAAERTYDKKKRRSAMDILRERKVNFEEDMAFARNVDKLIEKLKRSGALVIETTKHGRVVVHPEAWEEFWQRLSEAGSSEEEVMDALNDERLFKLFEALREDGLIYYDVSRGWTASPDLRKSVQEE